MTWDCVDIAPVSIEQGRASIFVEKELQRVNRSAMQELNEKDIMFKFPHVYASGHTALILKTPKTKTSVRKVFLPKTVAELLIERKATIEEYKEDVYKRQDKPCEQLPFDCTSSPNVHNRQIFLQTSLPAHQSAN